MFVLYKWILPDQSVFLQRYNDNDNDTMLKVAQDFWNSIVDGSLFFFLIAVFVGIGCSFYYYFRYTKKPGRRYKVSHSVLFLFIAGLFSALATFIAEKVMIETQLTDVTEIYIKVMLVNFLYAIFPYFIAAIFICGLLPKKTCAYTFFKSKKNNQ